MVITAFPVLVCILAELKLLATYVGRIAMSAVAFNDVVAWTLLALALSGSDSSHLVSLWVLLCGTAFVVFFIFVLKPILSVTARRSLDGEPVGELYICITLSLVLAAGFITDIIGINALFSAFMVGIIIPKDSPFTGMLIEKIEDLFSGLFLPLYFASNGLKTNITTIKVGLAMLFNVPFVEALALGVLMNTKGLVELIVLNIGKDRKVLTDQSFVKLVLMALFTTFITTPILMAVYKPARKGTPYNHRMIWRKDPDTELRVLACFYNTRNIPTLINLIKSSRGTRKKDNSVKSGLPFWNKVPGDQDQMVIAFEAYQQLRSVVIRPMNAISALNSIHDDIFTSAERKRAALIIMPFHKHQRVDGTMESLGHSFHLVNQRVLRHAPCSVGILVDRGLGGTTQVVASEVSYSVVVPFFGGQDDREALSYGIRIAKHGIKLTILKFTTKPETEPDPSRPDASTESVKDNEIFSDSTLFLVGITSPAMPLSERSTDCPKLGHVGSYLASSDFSTTSSILVIQQYDPSINDKEKRLDDANEASDNVTGSSSV
ncbi:Cation/H(+) antiporter 19 [Hibiscus syriacus]|uniref:Cation/H(+) antiporter 19 n=1 Tax=Hibiscus syriacus TaxID=106335 RepID=A0A6A3CM84_HIBSY|nr:Cation/H(+) antiporter 19 [Hibiscus syriacus]